MTERASPTSAPAAPLPERLPLTVLTGLRRLPDVHALFVHAGQLRAAERLWGVLTALTLISVFLLDVRLFGHGQDLLLGIWTVLTIGIHVPGFVRRRANVASDYSGVGRRALLRHGLLALMQGMSWTAAFVAFGNNAHAADISTMWTIGCCLMAGVAIAWQATPLSALAYLSAVGGGAAWMMLRHADPMLVAVVTTYTVLLLAASLHQAYLFGVQLTTSKLLAEKREVVSLLLKEHDVEGSDWLWQTDIARRLTVVSPAMARMFGRSSEELQGRSILELLAGPAWEEGKFDPALHDLAEKLKQRHPFSDLVLPVVIDGRRMWWEISASPRVDEKGLFVGFHGVGSDITERKESAERIAQLARYDTLTGLPNRPHLTDALKGAIDRVMQVRTRCGFLMIDLDRFKAVNDTLGHLVGDKLLAQVAERLSGVCTRNEICGRLGGDEFAVVLRDVPDQLYVDQLSAAIIENVSRPYVIDNHTLFIGATIGSAVAPTDGVNAETLIRSADLAMYCAKEAGRGRHMRYAPEMHADAEERRQLEIALRDALAHDELSLLFQPIVRARSGEIARFEALVRWHHPEMGQVPPDKFIPIAEEARLIGAIGDWVLRSACREAASWPSAVGIAVNVSAEQLYEPNFFNTVMTVLNQTGLAPQRLELEVTESVFLREGTGAAELLERLARAGVRLSLDDFGTGYSSLGYLSRNRFSTIKIDRSFVAGAARNQRECLAIVHAVVAMAQSLDMETTAEGVETQGEFDLLRAMGCTTIQGFYFGRPMPAADALALFRNPARSA